jgi:predicted amidohydrolase
LPGGVVVAELDVRRVREVRERFPFLRDRAAPDLAARS